MAGRQGTVINADHGFRQYLTSLRQQLSPQQIRHQLRDGASFNPDVARVVAETAGRLAGVLPFPVGLALQSVLFLAEAPLQAHDNTAEAASLSDQLQHVKEKLERLAGLGSLPDNIQADIDRIAIKLVQLSLEVDDLRRTPAPSGWRKCISCLQALVCAKCKAKKLQRVATILSRVLNEIGSALGEIIARRAPRPAERAPKLPAHRVDMHDRRVSKVMDFLRTNTSGNQSARVVGLYGQGGIGKTTLMNAIHHHLLTHDTTPQLHKIATVEVGMTPLPPSIIKLQESLSSQLRGGEQLIFSSAAQGRSELESLLADLRSKGKPVCIFIDNVWEFRHLAELLPENLADVLPGESYMVITSRSEEVTRRLGQMCFKSEEEEKQGYFPYELELLGEEDAMKLFLETAGERRALSRDDELVRAVVPLCGGLPLALAVYGAFFKDESKRQPQVWKYVCKELKAAQDLPPSSAKDRVFEKLKLSITFQKEELQDAFLDVALFFNGKEFDTVKYAMKEVVYLDSLVDQSLIRVREDLEEETKWVVVHDLFVLVAQKIAQERRIATSAPMSEHEPTQVRYFDLQRWPKDNYPSASQMEGCRYLLLNHFDSEDFLVNYFVPTITSSCHNIRLLQLSTTFWDKPHFKERVFPWMANLKELTILLLSAPRTSRCGKDLRFQDDGEPSEKISKAEKRGTWKNRSQKRQK